MKLSGRNAVVTGGGQGLGFAIARKLISEGASVLLCGRDQTVLDAARTALMAETKEPAQKVCIIRADVSRPEDVSALFAVAKGEFPTIDVLVNNAGILGPLGAVETTDWDEWQKTISVNFLGAVACCRAVVPIMKSQRRGKIINLSGGGVTKPLTGLSAYAASKAALVNFTATLAEETRPYGIDVNAVAPGALATRMLCETLNAGPEKVGAAYYEQTRAAWEKGGTPLDIPAALCAYLAGTESDGISGRLIAALWDPWRDFAAHREDIMSGDIYTMRRIVPSDRALDWGDVS